MKRNFTTDELVERVSKALLETDGDEIAELYNKEFGFGMAYVGDDGFEQDNQEISHDELIERIGECLQQMSGKDFADLYNREFGSGMTYVGNDGFEQDFNEENDGWIEEWTHEDNLESFRQGWGIFATDSTATKFLQIEKLDDPDALDEEIQVENEFEDDEAAIDFVLNSEHPVAKKAIRILVKHTCRNG